MSIEREFKVGDKVRHILHKFLDKNEPGLSFVIDKVDSNENTMFPYFAEPLGNGVADWFQDGQLELIEEKEEAVKVEKAEVSRRAFKVGDEVVATDTGVNRYLLCIRPGTRGRVAYVEPRGKAIPYKVDFDGLELWVSEDGLESASRGPVIKWDIIRQNVSLVVDRDKTVVNHESTAEGKRYDSREEAIADLERRIGSVKAAFGDRVCHLTFAGDSVHWKIDNTTATLTVVPVRLDNA